MEEFNGYRISFSVTSYGVTPLEAVRMAERAATNIAKDMPTDAIVEWGDASLERYVARYIATVKGRVVEGPTPA